ncbi:hypothetical protein B0H14DRAFT_3139886 [Mycena olivaceomarginata]|nr:hypothetical protein B0H14DRAFT_3139886 [Mycena olivaceomarginata]
MSKCGHWIQIRKHWDAKRSLRAGRTRGKETGCTPWMARELKAERRSARTPLRACAIRLDASGEHTRTANAHHASRTHIRGEGKRRHARRHCVCRPGATRRTQMQTGLVVRREEVGQGREAHTTRRRHGAHQAYSDACTYTSRMMCACGARRPGTQLPMPGERSGQGREEVRQTRPAGAEHPVRHRCGGRGRTGVVPRRARPSFIAHRMPRHEAHHTRVCGQAGMRAHADEDASCEVLYGGADADAGCEAGSLALKLVLACSGEQMPKRERPTDVRRTPPQLVEKPKDEMTPGPGPRQPARHMLYARIRRVTHLHVFAGLGSRSRSRCPLPFIHPSSPTPTTRPRRSPTLASSPSIALPAPASVWRSARGSWGVGARPPCVCARPNRGPGCGYAQALSPYTVATARGLSLEVRARSWVQEARYPSLELELAGANQDANGEDAPAAEGGFPVRKEFNEGRHPRSKCQSRRHCGRENKSARYGRASERVHDGRAWCAARGSAESKAKCGCGHTRRCDPEVCEGVLSVAQRRRLNDSVREIEREERGMTGPVTSQSRKNGAKFLCRGIELELNPEF